MYSEGSFRGSGSSGQVNGAAFVLLTHGQTALSAEPGVAHVRAFSKE